MLYRKRRKLPRLEKLRRFKVHPAFLAVGALAAITGRLTDFAVCTLSALIHECAHAFCGGRMGYGLDRIILMPYGAVVKGDVYGITFKDEVLLCLSGPLVNLAVAVCVAAAWWLFPSCYPYTGSVFDMNMSLFITNMIPAYPLDMGRILLRALSEKISRRKARYICAAISVFAAISAAGLFAYSCFGSPNFSALTFSILLLSGCFSSEKGEYGKIRFSYEKSLSRGVEVRRVAVSEEATLKTVIKFFSEDKYLVADIYSKEGEYLLSLRQEKLAALIEKEDIYLKFDEVLPDFTGNSLAKKLL